MTLPVTSTDSNSIVVHLGSGLLTAGTTLTVTVFSCVVKCPRSVTATAVVEGAAVACSAVPAAVVTLSADIQSLLSSITDVVAPTIVPLLQSIQSALDAIVVDADPCCAFLLSPYLSCVASYAATLSALLLPVSPVLLPFPQAYGVLALALNTFVLRIGTPPSPPVTSTLCTTVCAQVGVIIGNVLFCFERLVSITLNTVVNPLPSAVAAALTVFTVATIAAATPLFTTPCDAVASALAAALPAVNVTLVALAAALSAEMLTNLAALVTALSAALDAFSSCIV